MTTDKSDWDLVFEKTQEKAKQEEKRKGNSFKIPIEESLNGNFALTKYEAVEKGVETWEVLAQEMQEKTLLQSREFNLINLALRSDPVALAKYKALRFAAFSCAYDRANGEEFQYLRDGRSNLEQAIDELLEENEPTVVQYVALYKKLVDKGQEMKGAPRVEQPDGIVTGIKRV